MAAGAADAPAVGLAWRPTFGRLDAQHVAAGEEREQQQGRGAFSGPGLSAFRRARRQNLSPPGPPGAIASGRSTRSSVEVGENSPRSPPPDSGFMIIICAVSGWRSVAAIGMRWA